MLAITIIPTHFDPGNVVATPGALAVLIAAAVPPADLLARHLQGDWGDLDPTDRMANDHALRVGGRLFSAYTLPGGERLWIITEGDRSYTTLLLPSEY